MLSHNIMLHHRRELERFFFLYFWQMVLSVLGQECLFYEANQDLSTMNDFNHHYVIASQKPLNMCCHGSSSLGNFGKHGHTEIAQPGISSRLFGNCFGEGHALVNAVENALLKILSLVSGLRR